MDLTRSGLRRRVFAPTADVAAFLTLAPHAAALDALRRGMGDGYPAAALLGEAGVGKTVTALKFLADQPAGGQKVFLPAAKFARPVDLFQAILFDLGVEFRGLTETEARLAVTDRLLTAVEAGGPTVLVLDEAQLLGDEVLEEVRLLGNLSGRAGPAAFVVLVGAESLADRLAGSPLAGRLAARHTFTPLDADDSGRFIRDQLAAAGGRADRLIDDEAVGLLAAHCAGSPRLLNQAAAAAFALAEGSVDAEAVVEVLTRLGVYEEPPPVLPHPAQAAGRRGRKRKSA